MGHSIHDYVVACLEKSDVWEVHQATRLPVSTLRKIRDGVIKNPGVKGVEALYYYFLSRERAGARAP